MNINGITHSDKEEMLKNDLLVKWLLSLFLRAEICAKNENVKR